MNGIKIGDIVKFKEIMDAGDSCMYLKSDLVVVE